MKIPGFAEDSNRIRLGLDQGDDIIVLIRCHLGATGGPERGDLGMGKFFLFDILEKSHILGVTSRPATLDIMYPQIIKPMGNSNLILKQKRDILGLCPISQCCIIQFYKVHDVPPQILLHSDSHKNGFFCIRFDEIFQLKL